MFIALVLLVIVGGAVLVFRNKTWSVHVSELWKLFFGIILISFSDGMSPDDVSLNLPKIGMLAVGSVLVVWFVVAALRKLMSVVVRQESSDSVGS